MMLISARMTIFVSALFPAFLGAFATAATSFWKLGLIPDFPYCIAFFHKIKEVFCKTAVDFCFDNGFTTTEKYLDIAKHKITCLWKLNGESLCPLSQTVEKDSSYSIENLSELVLPYAFLEEFMLGEIVNELLCDSIKDNAKFLNDYLGEYIGVFPPPSFRKFDEVALLYKNGNNKYKTEYFTFELKNRKICNIKRSDN